MGDLIVRDVEEDVIRALERRAAKHGRSAEAEHRAILREVLVEAGRRPSFKEFLLTMPDVGEDEDFAPPRDRPRQDTP